MPSACCRHINKLDPDGRFYVLCRWQRCKNSLRMTTRRPRLWVAGKKHARFVASSRLSPFRHPGILPFVIPAQAGIQLTTFVINLCHSALLRKFCGTQNWIPPFGGMTTAGPYTARYDHPPAMAMCGRQQNTRQRRSKLHFWAGGKRPGAGIGVKCRRRI